jgi:putative FmdB family regulatory protein
MQQCLYGSGNPTLVIKRAPCDPADGSKLKRLFTREVLPMPLYEYMCLACGKNFEKLTLHGEEQLKCPNCGRRVQKLMSIFSHQIPDEVCGKLPKGERRELCTECKKGGRSCPAM